MFLTWIYYGLGHGFIITTQKAIKKAAYIRDRQIEMSKYVSYTMKALAYSKPCTEEQTREKEMSVTALLSHGN